MLLCKIMFAFGVLLVYRVCGIRIRTCKYSNMIVGAKIEQPGHNPIPEGGIIDAERTNRIRHR